MQYMNKLLIFGLLFVATVFAIAEQDKLQIHSYDFSFIRPDRANVNKEVMLSVSIADSKGAVAGLDVQGQILDAKVGKEIYYAAVSETKQGTYTFSWTPSFAGDYFVQFIFRSASEEILQPTFVIRVGDLRATYAWIAGVVVAIICVAAGVYMSLPKKRKSFVPLLVSLIITVISLGLAYSVATFYQTGGERGFIVCSTAGCELAVHYHSQLEINVCGKPVHLPLEAGDLNRQHTHKERDRLHYHSLIRADEKSNILEPEKLRLGELFDTVGIKFTKECFDKYCNGDKCPDGKQGRLLMLVNGLPNEHLQEYNWKDGDKIKIEFE